MSENTQGKLKGLKEKLNLRGNISPTDNKDEQVDENVSEQITEGPESRTTRYKRLLDSIVISGLLTIAEDKLSDDVFIESMFSKAYELLPVPVRLVVRREWCLDYLQSRKAPLLAQLQLYRAERHGSAEMVPPALEPTLPPAT
ncbi:hypothetical protein B9F30_14950 [Salmonella enterica subsp. enterica serovar Newport]|uniref:hypothetical protein n=1 Tax=Citrobacter freundii TaxID=546 RepID=UPI00126C094A|nr:hypothetical protein [Citrobacter freundii]EAS1229257.1 hypothetical protein [Salmonella enterica]EDB9154081.1 hypothetical protein [Salmonella enterica subsp. enterica serovar Newport]EDQ6779012.1 hypothetical protein [Salmonella enterica subsp. enterica serovar Overschie]EAT9627354.1 hypothetical protein [Salmonella enterica]EBH5035941.1 hypothetical protein [Salmonella enterica]